MLGANIALLQRARWRIFRRFRRSRRIRFFFHFPRIPPRMPPLTWSIMSKESPSFSPRSLREPHTSERAPCVTRIMAEGINSTSSTAILTSSDVCVGIECVCLGCACGCAYKELHSRTFISHLYNLMRNQFYIRNIGKACRSRKK